MFVYRYSAAQWNGQLVTEGRLRLGTLHGYRDEERLPPPIGDAGEGRKTIHAVFDDYDSARPGGGVERAAMSEIFNMHAAPGARVVLRGQQMRQGFSHPDAYLSCVSRRAAPDLLQRLSAETCVAIDLFPFHETLCKHLDSLGLINGSTAGWIHYGSRDELWEADVQPLHPAFIKPSSYAWQEEGRFVFYAVAQPVQPLSVHCPDLRAHCRRVL